MDTVICVKCLVQEGEVAYVDAQRNMAVALGERDVKTDVKIKEVSDSALY